jgi:hypothetical protein
MTRIEPFPFVRKQFCHVQAILKMCFCVTMRIYKENTISSGV